MCCIVMIVKLPQKKQPTKPKNKMTFEMVSFSKPTIMSRPLSPFIDSVGNWIFDVPPSLSPPPSHSRSTNIINNNIVTSDHLNEQSIGKRKRNSFEQESNVDSTILLDSKKSKITPTSTISTNQQKQSKQQIESDILDAEFNDASTLTFPTKKTQKSPESHSKSNTKQTKKTKSIKNNDNDNNNNNFEDQGNVEIEKQNIINEKQTNIKEKQTNTNVSKKKNNNEKQSETKPTTTATKSTVVVISLEDSETPITNTNEKQTNTKSKTKGNEALKTTTIKKSNTTKSSGLFAQLDKLSQESKSKNVPFSELLGYSVVKN